MARLRAALLAGWRRHPCVVSPRAHDKFMTDGQGGQYYFNSQTQQVTWEKPSLLLPGWKEAMAHDGRVYYYNKKTKATSWHMPPKEFGRST